MRLAVSENGGWRSLTLILRVRDERRETMEGSVVIEGAVVEEGAVEMEGAVLEATLAAAVS